MDAGLAGSLVVLCRVKERMCGVPLEHVGETMRPLPVDAVAGMPTFLRGVSIIRGKPVPVIDAAALLSDGRPDGIPGRFVTINLGARQVALAVDEVRGVRRVPTMADLPPLLADAGRDAVEAMSVLDDDLLLILRGARLVPATVWAALDADRASG